MDENLEWKTFDNMQPREKALVKNKPVNPKVKVVEPEAPKIQSHEDVIKQLATKTEVTPEEVETLLTGLNRDHNVVTSTSKETDDLLDAAGANALYWPGGGGKPGIMLIRTGAKPEELIEEMMHLMQHEKTGWKRLSVADILRLEVQAHNDLLRYAEENGWSAEQKAKLKQNRDYWEAQQKGYGKDKAVTEAMDAQVGAMTAKKRLPEIPGSLKNKLSDKSSKELAVWLSNKILNYKNTPAGVVDNLILNDIDTLIGNRKVLDSFVDSRGNYSFVLESDGITHDLISIERNVDGEDFLSSYNRAYNQNATTSIDVGTSRNGLVPDYTIDMHGNPSTRYLYPQSQLAPGKSPVVRIKMTGKRKGKFGDFYEANKQAGLDARWGSEAPRGYVWHHMDDFDPITGECTMQLVESGAHTRVPGMAHSGSVAQWKKYYISQDNAPSKLFYTD